MPGLQSPLFYRLFMVIKTIPGRLSRGHYFQAASALSFSTVLAIVPLMTVVFSALSLFPIFKTWSGAIQDFIYRNFVPQLGEQVQHYLQEFSANAGQLTIVGLIFLIFTTLTLLATIENAFNEIWDVKEGRPVMQRVLVYWAMLTLGPVLIAVSLSVSSYLFSMSVFQGPEVVRGLQTQLLSVLPFMLELLGFVFFYNSVPNCDVRFKHALIGGVVATRLFELAKFGFGQYIAHFNSYQRIYGALAVLPVFLLWIYFSWLVVLIGAYITAAFGSKVYQQNAD